jgi:hypothetical protein
VDSQKLQRSLTSLKAHNFSQINRIKKCDFFLFFKLPFLIINWLKRIFSIIASSTKMGQGNISRDQSSKNYFITLIPRTRRCLNRRYLCSFISSLEFPWQQIVLIFYWTCFYIHMSWGLFKSFWMRRRLKKSCCGLQSVISKYWH